MTSQLHSHFDSVYALSAVKNRASFPVRLGGNYIARGRLLSDDHIVVDILDESEMADLLRAQPQIDFEIETEPGIRILGSALARVGASRAGESQRRFVEVTLSLQTVMLNAVTDTGSRWLT